MENSNSPLNIFITGAATGLGREVTRLLSQRGHRVTGLTDSSQGGAVVRQNGGLPAYSDLYRPGEMKSVIKAAEAAVVVHLAPQAANDLPMRGLPWAESVRAISAGTDSLLDAAAAMDVNLFILASYGFVYGDTGGEWVDETAPTAHSGDYEGAAFDAALAAEKRVLNGTLPGCVLHAGYTYGAHTAGVNAFDSAVRRSRSVYLGAAGAYANWVHVSDMALAVALAAEANAAGEIFNVADDAPASPLDFAGYYAGALGLASPEERSLPGFMLRVSTDEMQRSLLGLSLRLKNDKIKQTLGWNPRYPTHAPGIEQALLVHRAGEAVGG